MADENTAPETETSLREDIEASLAELTADESTETAAPEPDEQVQTDEPDAPVADTASEEPQDALPARERDEKGRFKAKTAAEPAGAADPAAGETPDEALAASPAAPVVPTPVEPQERAPQSWKPLAREHWAKLPAEVRQEVARREQETNRVLQESAEARRGYQQFREAIGPFEAMIRAEAGDPIRGIQGLLGTAYLLRSGTPQQKAAKAAELIGYYGVDIDHLAAALDGKAPPAQQAQVADPRVDMLYQRLEQAERAAQARAVEGAQSQLDEAAGRLEFFEDLRQDMADIMQLATARGQKMTLDQAYQRALQMSPDHQKIIQQREAAKRAESAKAQTQRARAAASSVASRPAVAPRRANDDTSLREDIEAAMRELNGR